MRHTKVSETIDQLPEVDRRCVEKIREWAGRMMTQDIIYLHNAVMREFVGRGLICVSCALEVDKVLQECKGRESAV